MFTYRRATTDDIELIHSIAKVAFPATYSTIISAEQIDYMMEWMYSAKKLQQEISGNITYLLAEVDGHTVGYLSFGPDEGSHSRLFHLHKIYLLPEAQGGGNGKRLFMAGEREMRLAGATAFELNVNRGNPALGFYRHLGMQLSRSGDFDIGGGFFMNDHIMRKELF
ncbi:MAG: GNAT family N-acetyltransferase [bacterium]|nr:GNAT family N-acetyltransferase [bacterium]